MPITLSEVRELFAVFDNNDDDAVSCKELIIKLYPPPPKPDAAARGAVPSPSTFASCVV